MRFGGGKPQSRKKEEAAPAAYEMPAVGIGDVVMWGGDVANEPDCPAIVVRVYGEAVNVLVFHDGFHNMNSVDGVRHADHPDRMALKNSGSGHWRHRQSHQDLVDRVAALEAQLADLVGPPAAGKIANAAN